MKRTHLALKEGVQLKLYKISSNLKSVPMKFLVDDLAKDLKDFEIRKGDKPVQRSLGISWDINPDVFTFKISSDQKPFTRMEVLSTINSLFDPPPPWIRISSNCAREDIILAYATNLQWNRLGQSF